MNTKTRSALRSTLQQESEALETRLPDPTPAEAPVAAPAPYTAVLSLFAGKMPEIVLTGRRRHATSSSWAGTIKAATATLSTWPLRLAWT